MNTALLKKLSLDENNEAHLDAIDYIEKLQREITGLKNQIEEMEEKQDKQNSAVYQLGVEETTPTPDCSQCVYNDTECPVGPCTSVFRSKAQGSLFALEQNPQKNAQKLLLNRRQSRLDMPGLCG